MLPWIVVIIIVVALAAVFFIARWQSKNLRKIFQLEIVNQGNLPSSYELKADDPEGALEFKFSLRGRSLATGAATEAGQVAQSKEQGRSSVGAPASAGVAASAGDLKGKAQSAMGISGAIADVLGSLGMMLPRSIGAPLREMSSTIRQGRGRAQQVQNVPGRVGGQVTKIKAPIKSAKSTGSRAAPSAARPAEPVAQPVAQPVEPVLQAATPGWVPTPSIEPGQNLKVDLAVKPLKPSRTEYYSFAILSRPAKQSDVSPSREEWSGQVTGLSGLRRFHPHLLIVALSVFFILLAFWLASVGVLS